MTLYTFNSLANEDQYKTTFNMGTFIDYKIIDETKYALYAIDMFFVEVEYNGSLNKILDLKSFETGYLLDKYSSLKI